MAPTLAQATATPQPTNVPVPTAVPTNAPVPTAATSPVSPAETPPPPTPDAPLGEALRRFDSNALLYTLPDRFLMLAHPDGRHLWLTADERYCGRSNTALSQSGAWSVDGRYVAITCQDDEFASKLLVELATVNILDLETGKIHRVEVGSSEEHGVRVDAGAGPWSPAAPRLLVYMYRVNVNEADSQYSYRNGWALYDASTGTVRELITFDPEGGSYGDAAWSPDGSQVAVIGQRAGDQRADAYLINADGSGVSRLKLNGVTSFYGFAGPIVWSTDGQSLLLTRELRPSADAFVFQMLRVDVKSGNTIVLADKLSDLPAARWSPNGRWFLLKKYATADRTIVAWSLYKADGTLVRTFSSEPVRSVEDLAWLADGRLAFAVNRVNFGVELVIADVSGKEQVAATRPGAFAHKIAVAPDDSLFAIQLDDRIVVFDAQGALRSELDGTLQGWRPTG
jgi:dipeptidyl aminopeptidase/acylaminoacyl peptidase